MRKSVFLVVQPVGKLFSVCGGYLGLLSVVINMGVLGVHKRRGFSDFIQRVLPAFIHQVFVVFVSEKKVFVPIIHTTYNKLQLININNFVFNTRRLK